MGLYWPPSQKQNFRAFLVARISTRSVLDTRSKLLDARNKISRDARLAWMLDVHVKVYSMLERLLSTRPTPFGQSLTLTKLDRILT